ncbi:Glucose 1-dehydrogenase [Thiorhodovibrio winogradskyi]|uniref:Glucose 1-dehydrogenase n=1 Tax=Thiorhodovibrio winogradskyi TaxID=77007 RepID=A0ABZ0SCQ5_9GAMM|nr:SDR family NAD(P)-dependent oxidoreductase [Thiorhodovibrio winogradskyi]
MTDDLRGHVALITGATDGIGRLTASRLSARRATVLVHGRSRDKVDAVVAEIEGKGGKARGLVADLAAAGRVRALAGEVLEATPQLDILINNAGVGDPGGPRRESDDGYELHFAVNTLAPVVLTRLLAGRLAERAPDTYQDTSQDKGGARVVMVASAAQAEIDFDNLMLTRGYDGKRAYAQSKLALIMATMELAEELKSQGVTVNALHPGTLLNTKMVRQGFGSALGPADAGAEAEEHLATAPMLADITGAYFDRMDQAEPEVQAGDGEARRRLMALIDQLAEAV